jgi:hypothetical protein
MADDIEEVRQAEIARGRKGKASLESKKRMAENRREIEKLLKRGTDAGFYKAMRDLGILPDSPIFQAALKVWRAERYH